MSMPAMMAQQITRFAHGTDRGNGSRLLPDGQMRGSVRFSGLMKLVNLLLKGADEVHLGQFIAQEFRADLLNNVVILLNLFRG
jgi:hypothetical protein